MIRALPVLLCALAVAGCSDTVQAPAEPTITVGDDPQVYPGAPAPAATPRPPSDVEQLQELIRQRSDAFADGDQDAVAATATRAQARRDRKTVDAVRDLRLRAVELELEDVRMGEGTARVQASFEYGLPNVPGRYAHLRTLRLEQELGGSWRVTSDRPAGRERYPWEVTDLAIRRGAHFVILHPAATALGDLPALLEQAYDAMAGAGLPGRLQRRYLVTVSADPAQAGALTSGIMGLDTLSAIADSDVRERGRAKRVSDVVGQRLVLVWSNFAPLDAQVREMLVTHELTHLALARRTSGRTPAWLVEGAAMLVAGDRRIFEPGAPSLAQLSGPRAIGRLTGAEQADAYGRASAAAFAIERRFGRDRFWALYDAFNDPTLTGVDAAALADAATREVLGISLQELDASLGRA